MAYSAKVREVAFEVWYACGLNESECSRVMESEHDYIITRQTIAEWRDKYGWKRRATQMDISKQEASDNILSFEEELLASLIKQKERYDRYFDSLEDGKVDTQAMYAYTQLCKQLKDLHKELRPKPKKQTKKGLDSKTVQEIRDEFLGA